MSAGAASDEQAVDLRGTRPANVLMAAFFGPVAGALLVGAVLSARDADLASTFLLVAIAAGLVWLAVVTLSARLRAGPDGIAFRVGGRTATTPWSEVRSIYRVCGREGNEGLVAVTPGGRLILLSRVGYGLFRPFAEEEVTHAARVLDDLAKPSTGPRSWPSGPPTSASRVCCCST